MKKIKVTIASRDEYQVGGEISAPRLKWACIEEVDNKKKMLYVTDEDGGDHEIRFGAVDSYNPPKKDKKKKAKASDDNTSILKELSKILKTSLKADESKTLSIRTRKKCLSLIHISEPRD